MKNNKQTTRFEIAKDVEPKQAPVPKKPSTSTQNTDSGYHGMTEDEMEVDAPTQESSQKTTETEVMDFAHEPKAPMLGAMSPSEGQRTTDGSFHSAKEEQTAKLAASLMQPQAPREPSPAESPMVPQVEAPIEGSDRPAIGMEVEVPQKRTYLDLEKEFEDIGSPSDGSTPDRPLVRKSSLTFASLPAREPLPTKKSMGNRVSRTSQIDQSKVARNSYMGRITGNARLTEAQVEGMDVDRAPVLDRGIDHAMEDRPASRDESDAETRATRLHNKSSTQRLHEKIDMLGKTQPTRHSKSIPNLAVISAKHAQGTIEPSQSTALQHKPSAASITTDDDDDWIKPLSTSPNGPRPGLTKSHTMDLMEQIPERDTVGDLDFHIPAPEQWYQQSPDDEPAFSSPRKFGHMKSASTITLVSPSKASMDPIGHSKNISVSNPPYGSTTPYGSPKRTMMHSPISASKSKLQSIMKTAKGLFTSSAGISAAAKMEVLSPNRAALKAMPGLYPNLNNILDDKPLPPSPKDSRRTRSSTERERAEEKKERERLKVDDQLEKAREKERQKAADFKVAQESTTLAKPSRPTEPTRKSPRRAAAEESATAGQQQTAPPTASAPKTNEVKRPVRPTKETLQKSRPQPVAIKVGTMSQRGVFPPPNNGQASAQDTAPPAASKPAMTKKPSTSSVNTTASNSTFKSSVGSQPGKPKALILAAQKREQVCHHLS